MEVKALIMWWLFMFEYEPHEWEAVGVVCAQSWTQFNGLDGPIR